MGSSVNNRAVISRDVVMKHLHQILVALSGSTALRLLGVGRPLDAEGLVMVACVCPVQSKRGKLSDEMIGCSPYLNVGVVSYGNVSSQGVSRVSLSSGVQ